MKRGNSLKASQLDRKLLQVAVATLNRLYQKDRHEVAAAVRCRNGSIYSGIHIEAKYSGYADICGEVAAICVALADGNSDFASIVAIQKDSRGGYRILPPCGRCRDVISDFSRDTMVLLGEFQNPQKSKISALVPHKPL